MNVSRVFSIMRRELMMISREKSVVVPLLAVPVILSVILPIVVLAGRHGSNSGAGSFVSAEALAHMQPVVPIRLEDSYDAFLIYVVLVILMLPLFLLIPVMISNVIAGESFVGERVRRTMEGLLYTPVTNEELAMGKILACWLPAIFLTWLCSAAYMVLVDSLGQGMFGMRVFPNGSWTVAIVVVAPLLAFLSVVLVVTVSQHVESVKASQSISMVLVLPLLLAVVGAIESGIVLGAGGLWCIAGVLLLLDIVFFCIAARFIDRARLVGGR